MNAAVILIVLKITNAVKMDVSLNALNLGSQTKVCNRQFFKYSMSSSQYIFSLLEASAGGKTPGV